MSLKQSVLDGLKALEDSVSALPEDPSVADLQAKLDAASSALAADEAKVSEDEAKVVDVSAQLDAANSKLAAVKAALGL